MMMSNLKNKGGGDKDKGKNLPRVMERVMCQPWAIMDDKMGQLSELLMQHVRGDADISQGAYMDESSGGDDDEGYVLVGSVAVVSLAGVIGKRLSWLEMYCGGCDVDQVKSDIMSAMLDERVKAVVLDIDSPGGMVTGTPELANFIAEASEEKPIMAYTEMMMCSAAYWLGCAAGEVFCSESAIVGSIGVVCSAVDQSEAWKREGFEKLVFRSSSMKCIGQDGERWSEEWRTSMQKGVEESAEKFYSHVRAQRGGDLDAACFTGDYWSGEVLLELGLVDGFCDTLEDFVGIVNLQMEDAVF